MVEVDLMLTWSDVYSC